MAEVRLTPAARGDLDAIFDHSVAAWGLPRAMAYADRIEAAFRASADAPMQAASCDHIRSGYRRRSVGQHVIFFRPTDYGIAVVRILHRRMDHIRHL
ncbi:type II toxin-antitoxin system RelE/ParE family toxin [Sphingomonas hankookensis]|jgi:toxin ParE1/3/4|uniref:type II toxin-antitoxin system RelE/ParE family toxin n=1 Tax=Sphingomonas hankookensis TaxID=563996 RepID=UPI001F58EDDF|nr:type II toxin-antitoxin system RelE/ParE family toxin [Sphingomonas hankookensis]